MKVEEQTYYFEAEDTEEPWKVDNLNEERLKMILTKGKTSVSTNTSAL
jgi:hypothetical protein